MEPSV
jgi:transposase InsO family protein